MDSKSNSDTVHTSKGSSTPRDNRTGWGQMSSTSAFRAINFELYAKPNKFVMTVGLSLFLGGIGYIAYMNFTDDKTKKTYVTYDLDGGLTPRPKTSKWD